ncbi:hypothetical protein CONCODRAFT_77832 [Conidiobolus coronatus NRRL 28638]|uniref:Transmembrane protein 198 n=1 Tax=Conidiobolus coronatus (strain ATCC 28846 / CBS 209.66 / NRRL 28638) TaxID=796925 RepID=A0A137PBP6_CONC2|nr:hypothetical protein CONCODRAFT_77832 [Conidiobolus coronatus NRRL 28638]|eukprot:KXN72386.1 hypothetical protein CONCODRAFT_77832 [Conidiobolus coronatus NRRL 28638]
MSKSLHQLYILTLWSILICLGYANAQSTDQTTPPATSDKLIAPNPIGTPNKSAAFIVSGVLCMIIGLLFVFVGKKLIRFLIAFAGAFAFFIITITISAFIVDFNSISNNQTIIILVSAGIFAVAGGILSACMWKVGMVLLGFLNGISLGQIVTRAFVAKPWVQVTVMGSVGLIFAIFTCFAMNLVTIAYTSFFGAHLFITGVDLIANTGYNQFSTSSITNGEVVSLSPGAWGMFASVFIISIIGTLFQWKTVKSKTQDYEPIAAREVPEK